MKRSKRDPPVGTEIMCIDPYRDYEGFTDGKRYKIIAFKGDFEQRILLIDDAGNEREPVWPHSKFVWPIPDDFEKLLTENEQLKEQVRRIREAVQNAALGDLDLKETLLRVIDVLNLDKPLTPQP
jgi:hypothetical protein